MPVCAKIKEGGGKFQPPVKLKEWIGKLKSKELEKWIEFFSLHLTLPFQPASTWTADIHGWHYRNQTFKFTHLGGSVGFAVGVIKMPSSKGCAMFENEVLTPLSLFCGHYFGSNNKDANRDLIKCPIDEICTNKAAATVNLSTALLSREQTGLLLFLLLLTFIISSNA